MVTLRLPSSEMRMVRAECRATVGALSNAEHQNVKIGKAGRNRHKGKDRKSTRLNSSHVRSMRFSPEVFIASIRDISRSSTHGPFLLDRLIACLYLFFVPARCSGPIVCPSCACGNRASERPMG